MFGFQLVITMVMASILSKFSAHFSFAKWFLCSTGLRHYLPPTDDELRIAAKIGKEKNRKNRGKDYVKSATQNDVSDNDFTVPRNIDLELEQSIMVPSEVVRLHYYSEYQWLLDFSLCSLIVFILTEIYLGVTSIRNEVNLSVLWCCLVVIFALKTLSSLTWMYFKGDNSGGEKAMVILSFFAYLLIALGFLIIDESKLELGLDAAYSSFNCSAVAFLKGQGLDSDGPASKMTFKIILAIICAVIGAFFTFPGLRIGKMHWDSLRCAEGNRLLRLVLHVSFLAPLVLVVLWVKPLSRHILTEKIYSGYTLPVMSPSTYSILRIALIIVVCFLRLALMPVYLQSYLNIAYERLERQKKESGRIGNREFQKKIGCVFYYVCVVSLQYIAPLLLVCFISLILKYLGGFEWQYLLGGGRDGKDELLLDLHSSDPSLEGHDPLSEFSNVSVIGLQELNKVFGPSFYRGILGFTTWWCVFSWFSSGTFGVLYHTKFSQT